MFNLYKYTIYNSLVLQWLPVTALVLVYFSCRGHAEVRTDNEVYVTYDIGNVNIVISAPHGGRLKVIVATCSRRCYSSILLLHICIHIHSSSWYTFIERLLNLWCFK